MLCIVLQIDQDFTMLFGGDVSGKFLAKWPTFFKPRVIADCKNLPQSAHIDELLLSAQQKSDDDGQWKSIFLGWGDFLLDFLNDDVCLLVN